MADLSQYMVAKAEACAWAFRFRGLDPSRNAVRAILKLARQGEECIGDAPGLEGNWGATDRRALTATERQLIVAGKVPPPMDPFEQLHGDSDPKTGKFQTWFHRSMEPDGKTPNDVRAACILLCDLMDLRGFSMPELERCADDPTTFAKSLYERGYYRGFSTDPATAEAAYAANLAKTTVDDAIGSWSPATDLPPRPAFYQRDGETAEDVYARAVAHYCGCDDGAGRGPDGRSLPHHRTQELIALYAVTGDKAVEVSRLTNCGEFQLKLLGLLGCPHELAHMPYPQALQKHPEGALGMLRQIATDLGAVAAKGDDCWKSFTRGRLCLYDIAVKESDGALHEDAHEEGSQGTPDPTTGVCDHAGAGRNANAVSWTRDDVRHGPAGAPMVEVYATEKMVRLQKQPAMPVPAAPPLPKKPSTPPPASTTPSSPAPSTTSPATSTTATPATPPSTTPPQIVTAARHGLTAALSVIATFIATAKAWVANHEELVIGLVFVVLLLTAVIILSHLEARKLDAKK